MRCLFTTAIIIFFTYSDIEGTGIDFISTDDIICKDEEFCSLFGKQLICSKKLNNSYVMKSSEVEILILCHLVEDKLDLSNILLQFNNVQRIKIQQSQISKIYSSSSSFFSLKELNISKINLKNFTLPYLTDLSSLDISHNLIEYFPKEQLIMMPQLQKLYLAGNPIKCKSEMQWLLNDFGNLLSLVDEKETFCSDDNYKGKPILGIMKLFQRMNEDCPPICKCSLNKVVGDLVPIISVNCNNLSLTRFSKRIPVNTTILSLKHNKITNMMSLVNDRQYWNVKDVFLDYNQIKKIDGLEGCYWLNNFRLISLQGNRITQVHSYSLDNAFEHNQQLMRIYFGFNPWKCDCSFTPGFRELLLKYQDLVKDINDIRCAYHEDDENSMLPIAELPIKALCTDHSLPLHPLDYLSIIFASLTLLILGKLFYDWWYFKRTGKLPWLVTNMP